MTEIKTKEQKQREYVEELIKVCEENIERTKDHKMHNRDWLIRKMVLEDVIRAFDKM